MHKIDTEMNKIIFKLSTILLFLFIASCEIDKKELNELPSKYISLNDTIIHYKEYGEGDKTLIFIHGWGCDLNTWKYQFTYFKDNYRLLFIDLPGYGLSDKESENYTIDFFAESVFSLILERQINDLILIAHSMGLPVAMEVLKKLNSEKAKLCNLDGVYFDFPRDSALKLQYTEALDEFANMFNDENYEENVRLFCNDFISESTPEEVKNYILSTMANTPQIIGYQSMKSLIDQAYWDNKLITNQTLSIYAKTADLAPNNEIVMRSQFPNLTYHEMDSVNHFLMMEKPNQVNEIIQVFVEK